MDTFLSEIQHFDEDTTPRNDIKLINGKFGKVYVRNHTPTQKDFLFKQISNKMYDPIEIFVHQLMNKHKNFIKLFYSFNTLRGHLLIMDYIKGGDLFDLLRKEDFIPLSEVKFILREVIEALMALHKNHIIHNDIKLENILYNRPSNVYLCDYGLCKMIGTESCGDGTIDYFSPEKILGQKNDTHFDWWSVGVLCYELLTGDHPYKPDPDEDLKIDVLHYRQRQHINMINVPQCARNFVGSLLKYNINYRCINGEAMLKMDFMLK